MENDNFTIPYIVFESSMARAERQTKRLTIALVITVILMIASNLAWLYMWNSYEYVGESSISVEGEGNANYIGNDGDITNGESNSEKDEIPQEEEREQ